MMENLTYLDNGRTGSDTIFPKKNICGILYGMLCAKELVVVFTKNCFVLIGILMVLKDYIWQRRETLFILDTRVMFKCFNLFLMEY